MIQVYEGDGIEPAERQETIWLPKHLHREAATYVLLNTPRCLLEEYPQTRQILSRIEQNTYCGPVGICAEILHDFLNRYKLFFVNIDRRDDMDGRTIGYLRVLFDALDKASHG